MKIKLKSENGVISVFAMLAMMFFLLFIIGSYTAISRSNKTQKEINLELKNLYTSDINPIEVYNDFFASEDSIIPLEKLENYESFDFFVYNNKIYECVNRAADENNGYALLSAIICDLDEEDDIDFGEYKYALSDKLVVLLDGQNNSMESRSTNSKYWYNLAPNGKNVPLLYGDSNKYNGSTFTFNENGLILDGKNINLVCDNLNFSKGVISAEIVFTPKTKTKNQALIKNIDNLGGGLSINNRKLRGEFRLGGTKKIEVETAELDAGKINSVSLTYDGKNLLLYKNGKLCKESTKNSGIYETAEVEVKTGDYLYTESGAIGGGMNVEIGNYSKYQKLLGKSTTADTSKTGILYYPYITLSGSYSLNTQDSFIKYKYPCNEISGMDQKEYGGIFYRNISDLKNEGRLGNVEIIYTNINNSSTTKLTGNEYGYGNTSLINVGDFTAIAIGTNSMVLKSNLGQVENWYINKSEVTSNTYQIEETEILGEWYYSIKGLQGNTKYKISAKYKDESSLEDRVSSIERIRIGRNFDTESSLDYFEGVIHCVRIYDDVLSQDNILTNYRLDSKRFNFSK